MTLLAQYPLTVVMERRMLHHHWSDAQWSAVAVLPAGSEALARTALDDPVTGVAAEGEHQLVPGLQLQVYAGETDRCLENWAASEPKVFVLSRMRGDRAVPVRLSASAAEGGLAADDRVDAVPMPAAVHDWLGACLRQHRRPLQP